MNKLIFINLGSLADAQIAGSRSQGIDNNLRSQLDIFFGYNSRNLFEL